MTKVAHNEGYLLIVASRRHITTVIWVNFGSGDGLLPNGTKPLLNLCWLIISQVFRHSPKGNFLGDNFTRHAQDIYL